MRKITAAVLATTLLASSAFAAEKAASSNSSLAPGKPAGTKQAQNITPWIGPVVLGGAVIGLIVYAATYRDNNYTSSTSP